ncbi:receptor-interacting serine/threonine-protein kinase 3-like [Aulostomus maculatus]
MALLSNKPVLTDEVLSGWESVGSGGFGHVYKARHKDWGFDVAIKLLCHDVSPLIQEEASYKEATQMEKVSCEFVLGVYGLYQGCLSPRGTSMQQGIVMEFMRRGSIQSLQKDLSGPPPWPLAFRLAHQVALAMNFLHSRNIIHQDLKPNNVLLNDDLNAKLADFGLSRVSTSALSKTREATGEVGGSYKFMPPEAFKVSYEPVRAFDIYSYGILLWSIVTGKEPYSDCCFELVALRIPLGDRPDDKEIEKKQAEGLAEMGELMKRCWCECPSERPSFKECLEVTESVFTRHKKGIHDAVHQALTRLESPSNNQQSDVSSGFSCNPQPTEGSQGYDDMDHALSKNTAASLKLDLPSASTVEMTDADKAKFISEKRSVLIQNISEVMVIVDELGDMVHAETYARIEAKDTNQDQVRELYQRTLRSGSKVKAAFYDALKKHQPELVERLGG